MSEFIYDKRLYYNPVDFALAHIGGTWKIPILLCLRNGAMRYGDLKKSISRITDKMLITQLRELEEKGMLTRHSYTEKPPRVEYQLSHRGQKALCVIDHLNQYGLFLMKEYKIT